MPVAVARIPLYNNRPHNMLVHNTVSLNYDWRLVHDDRPPFDDHRRWHHHDRTRYNGYREGQPHPDRDIHLCLGREWHSKASHTQSQEEQASQFSQHSVSTLHGRFLLT